MIHSTPRNNPNKNRKTDTANENIQILKHIHKCKWLEKALADSKQKLLDSMGILFKKRLLLTCLIEVET